MFLSCYDADMRDLIILLVHLITTVDSDCGLQTDQSKMLRVAETLSRFIRNANSRMRINSPPTGMYSAFFRICALRNRQAQPRSSLKNGICNTSEDLYDSVLKASC